MQQTEYSCFSSLQRLLEHLHAHWCGSCGARWVHHHLCCSVCQPPPLQSRRRPLPDLGWDFDIFKSFLFYATIHLFDSNIAATTLYYFAFKTGSTLTNNRKIVLKNWFTRIQVLIFNAGSWLAIYLVVWWEWLIFLVASTVVNTGQIKVSQLFLLEYMSLL